MEPLMDEFDAFVSLLLMTLSFLCFWFGEDQLKSVRNQDYKRWYRKYGIPCGGVVTDRKFVGGRLFVRYAYRLPNNPAIAYIKDFVEAPKELKDHHKNIVVALVPRRSLHGVHFGIQSGIHYGLLQKLNSDGGTRMMLLKGLLLYIPFYIAIYRMFDMECSVCFYWPYFILFYYCVYLGWRIDRKADETFTQTVWKTIKRQKSSRNRVSSLFWDSWKLDEMERKANEDIFLALDRVEHDFAETMKSLDPCSSAGATTFSCEKYISFAPVCQEALQKDLVRLNP